jgi:hypothetical protein
MRKDSGTGSVIRVVSYRAMCAGTKERGNLGDLAEGFLLLLAITFFFVDAGF